VFEVAAGLGVELAALADLLRPHGGVGGEFGGFETLDLDLAGVRNAFADDGGGFAGEGAGGEFLEIDQRDLDMDVDAV
jgi:hypothetical protein